LPFNALFVFDPHCTSRTKEVREEPVTNINYLSTRDAAAKLSIGASTLKKLRIHGGGPPFHRIGRRVVYSTDILDEWAARETYETTSQYPRAH
jgi:excisionase family DNA binding protein